MRAIPSGLRSGGGSLGAGRSGLPLVDLNFSPEGLLAQLVLKAEEAVAGSRRKPLRIQPITRPSSSPTIRVAMRSTIFTAPVTQNPRAKHNVFLGTCAASFGSGPWIGFRRETVDSYPGNSGNGNPARS